VVNGGLHTVLCNILTLLMFFLTGTIFLNVFVSSYMYFSSSPYGLGRKKPIVVLFFIHHLYGDIQRALISDTVLKWSDMKINSNIGVESGPIVVSET
jgi:hypothetical protein